MAFQVPPSKRSIKQNIFEFQTEDGGKTFTVPKMKFLPVRVIAEMENGGLKAVLAAFGDEDAVKAVGELDSEQLEALTTAWSEESDISVGESSASDS